MYAFDVIEDMRFDEDLECLKRDNNLIEKETRAGKKYVAEGMKGVYDGGAYNVFWGQAPQLLKFTRFMTQWGWGRYDGDFFFDVAINLVKVCVLKEDVAE